MRKGLSIMEIAMACVLLVVAMVPILRALTRAHMFSATIERKTQSLALAQGKLDEIRARSIYHYSDSFIVDDLPLGSSYLCDVSDDEDASLRTVAVSVGYDLDGDNALALDEVEVTLTTYIARRW